MPQLLSAAEYTGLLEACLQAWNRADSEEVASFYAEKLDYRDPNVPEGLKTNLEFARYLRILFRKWPAQEWIPDEVFPHARPGAFSVCYRFRFGDGKRDIKGLGMDRIEFEGSKIRLNWVYLNAEGWGKLLRIGVLLGCLLWQASFAPLPLRAYGGSLSKPEASHVDLSDKTLLSFDEGSRRALFRYLEGNPRWEVREERGLKYAVRMEPLRGEFKTRLNGFYADESGRTFRQTRVLLALGRPYGFGRERGNVTRAKPGSKDVALIVEGEHSGSPGNTSYLMVEGGGLYLEIYEQSPGPRREFTQSAFDEACAELKDVLRLRKEIARTGLMPEPRRYPKPLPKKPRFVLHDGMQPGIYVAEAAIAPRSPGIAYIKAFDAKTGKRLSEDRMPEPSTRHVGWSPEGKTLFSYGSEITVYEGDRSREYEARFELWHRADSGVETKLAETKRMINGWER